MTEHKFLDILNFAKQLNPNDIVSIFYQIYHSIIRLLPLTSTRDRIQLYNDSIASHSVYWHFNDTLKMVLDCSFSQSQRIEALCDDWRRKGWIMYGIQQSNSAVITCQFDAFEHRKHLHFIDGSDGGYAKAVENFKKTSTVHNS